MSFNNTSAGAAAPSANRTSIEIQASRIQSYSARLRMQTDKIHRLADQTLGQPPNKAVDTPTRLSVQEGTTLPLSTCLEDLERELDGLVAAIDRFY